MEKQTTQGAMTNLSREFNSLAQAFNDATDYTKRLQTTCQALKNMLEKMKMNTISWEAVKEFYQKEFGIEGWVVEVYASMDILSLCVSGASNKDIEEFLEIPQGDIVKTIRQTFDFDGWELPLPINPYKVFCSYGGEKTSVAHFMDFVSTLSVELGKYRGFSNINIDKVFYMCETMYDIEQKIQEEWI